MHIFFHISLITWLFCFISFVVYSHIYRIYCVYLFCYSFAFYARVCMCMYVYCICLCSPCIHVQDDTGICAVSCLFWRGMCNIPIQVHGVRAESDMHISRSNSRESLAWSRVFGTRTYSHLYVCYGTIVWTRSLHGTRVAPVDWYEMYIIIDACMCVIAFRTQIRGMLRKSHPCKASYISPALCNNHFTLYS